MLSTWKALKFNLKICISLEWQNGESSIENFPFKSLASLRGIHLVIIESIATIELSTLETDRLFESLSFFFHTFWMALLRSPHQIVLLRSPSYHYGIANDAIIDLASSKSLSDITMTVSFYHPIRNLNLD